MGNPTTPNRWSMPCCLRLLASRVAPSTSLMLSSSGPIARLRIDDRLAKGVWPREDGCYAMAMTHEEFEALVGRLEAQARAHPVGYKLRVLLLALLGFGYLGVAVVVLLVLFVAALFSLVYLKALAVKLIIPIGAFLWVVLRALWITLEPPQGQPVRRREAPALFALVDKLQRTLGAPRFHDVLVTDDFNA